MAMGVSSSCSSRLKQAVRCRRRRQQQSSAASPGVSSAVLRLVRHTSSRSLPAPRAVAHFSASSMLARGAGRCADWGCGWIAGVSLAALTRAAAPLTLPHAAEYQCLGEPLVRVKGRVKTRGASLDAPPPPTPLRLPASQQPTIAERQLFQRFHPCSMRQVRQACVLPAAASVAAVRAAGSMRRNQAARSLVQARRAGAAGPLPGTYALTLMLHAQRRRRARPWLHAPHQGSLTIIPLTTWWQLQSFTRQAARLRRPHAPLHSAPPPLPRTVLPARPHPACCACR